MKLFDESTGPIFKAKIKAGAPISQDIRYMRWPACLAPGGGDVAADPDMEFDVQDQGEYFDLSAPGYGIKGQYGNGSIFVSSIGDLIMTEPHRSAALAVRREAKAKQLADAETVAEKLRAELDGLV
jgi:hypothetical protein